MNNVLDEKNFLSDLLDLLAKHFGDELEIVLHDLSDDLQHSIVDLRNGEVTNRQIGDYADKHGLTVFEGHLENGNTYNEIVYTENGKILKGSTMFIKNERGENIGSICLNQDITQSVKYEDYLKKKNGYQNQAQDEDLNEALERIIQEALKTVGKHYSSMTKEDKLNFIKILDDRGAFLISKSGPRICKLLKISKFTFYNLRQSLLKPPNAELS